MKILLIHTGGTIGSSPSIQMQAREQNSATVREAKTELELALRRSRPELYASLELVDSGFPEYRTTLSESMTPDKLSEIARFTGTKLRECKDISGAVILHGTDSLAYSAAVFSFLFADIGIPIFFVSGNRPPKDPESNAGENFASAIDLIARGISPNVYVTYRNSDGTLRLYLASAILQCGDLTEDFRSASSGKAFELEDADLFEKCRKLSANRSPSSAVNFDRFERLASDVLLIRPYTGLDYSIFTPVLANIRAVVHGTYHSGTLSYPGSVLRAEARKYRDIGEFDKAREFERQAEAEASSHYSIRYLAEHCMKNAVPLYIAPTHLGDGQYETVNAVATDTSARLLNMSTEAAYAKLITALAFDLTAHQLDEYMKAEINNEFI